MIPLLMLLALQPSGGAELLRRMHDRYAGKWYHTLTFVQTTVITRGEAKPDSATWYEALKDRRLRIDIASPTSGNGVIGTPDSVYSMRDGALARARTPGNPFIPLIMGVYLQDVAQTERELRGFGFDTGRSCRTRWQGREVTIVGTNSPSDTTSAQFWVDEDRLVVVRVRGALLGQSYADIRLAGYVRLGKGWLATDIDMQLGTVHQTELYRDWRAGTELPEAFFTVAGWSTTPHWAVQRP